MIIVPINIPIGYKAIVTAPSAYYLTCPKNDTTTQSIRLNPGDKLSVEVSTVYGKRRVALLVNGKRRMWVQSKDDNISCEALEEDSIQMDQGGKWKDYEGTNGN